MKKSVSELISSVENKVASMIANNPYGYSEGIADIASTIEKTHKFLTKDYDTASNYFTTEELNLYKSNTTEQEKEKGSQLYDTCNRVLIKAKQYRKERNRKTDKVETNLLTHTPFFLGGSRQRKALAQKEGYIQIDKKGIRKMKYENNLGRMLTMNDAKTLFALFSLWGEQSYGNWVSFTEYSILEKLNIGFGGKQYQTIRQSLEKLRNTSIVMQEAYDVEKGKRIETERFDLIIADKSTVDINQAGDVYARQYKIQFSPHIGRSFENGYYTLISLAAFNELEMESAQALYLLLSGVSNMEPNNQYATNEETLEIPLKDLYDTLFLEGRPDKNRAIIEKGCEELKSIDIIKDFHITKKGRSYDKLVVEKSEWFADLLLNKDTFPINESGQLAFAEFYKDAP